MRDAGYQYVVVDDCWFDPKRDAAGNLRANPTKFPSGMKALGRLHPRPGPEVRHLPGAGRTTCAQTVGAYPGVDRQQGPRGPGRPARSPSWGVDYLKYDWCSPSGTRDEQVARFTMMRDALRATGRPIVYSINPNSFHAITGDTYNWGEVADLWRTTEDLLDIWQNGNTNSYPMGVGNVLDVTAPLAAQSGPGHWNDPDMLVVGRPGLSLTESRSPLRPVGADGRAAHGGQRHPHHVRRRERDPAQPASAGGEPGPAGRGRAPGARRRQHRGVRQAPVRRLGRGRACSTGAAARRRSPPRPPQIGLSGGSFTLHRPVDRRHVQHVRADLGERPRARRGRVPGERRQPARPPPPRGCAATAPAAAWTWTTPPPRPGPRH